MHRVAHKKGNICTVCKYLLICGFLPVDPKVESNNWRILSEQSFTACMR